MRSVIALCCMILLLSGCDDYEGPVTDDVLFVEEGDCPSQQDVTSSAGNRIGTALEGDIDGDGDNESVSLYMDTDAESGCDAFVVVTLPDEGDVYSEPVWEIGAQGGLPQPRLNSLAQIDGDGGVEIVVDEIAGASTQFVGAFTFVDGALERIEPAEPAEDIWSGASEGVFPYGGSVGHVEAVDCVGEGEIVVSAALPGNTPARLNRGIYTVTRRFFEVEGAGLVETRTEEEEVRFDFGKTFPEFGSSPFGSCPSA